MGDSALRDLLPVYGFLLLWGVAWTASINGPVLPLYVRSLGIEVSAWSVLLVSQWAGIALSEWVWGAMVDRLDWRALIVASMICLGTLLPLYTLSSSIPYLAVLQFLSGVFAAAMGPATRSVVSRSAPGELLGLSMSLWWVFLTLGKAVGPLAGSYLSQLSSFRNSFYLSSIFCLVGAFVVPMMFRKKGRLNPSASSEKMLGMVTGVRALISMRSVRVVFIMAALAFLEVSLMTGYLPIYASERVGVSTVEVGVLVSAAYAAQLIAAPFLGFLSDRVGRKAVISAGFVISCLAFPCYLLVRSYYQLLLVSLAVSVCISANSMLLAMLSDVAPARLRGTAMGTYGTFEDLGSLIGPVVYGFVWNAYGPAFIFVAASATQIPGILLFLTSTRRSQQ
jgi:DHA1 family multidrug resistance protein-like MFS transporter